jgi:hypothetical protein
MLIREEYGSPDINTSKDTPVKGIPLYKLNGLDETARKSSQKEVKSIQMVE